MSTPKEHTENGSAVVFGSPMPESSPTALRRGVNYRSHHLLVQRVLFNPSEIPVRDYPFFVPMPPPDIATLDFEKIATYNRSMVDSPESTPVPQSPSVRTTELGEASIAGTLPGLEGNLDHIDPALHPLTLDEGRVVQRERAGRSHAALLLGRRTTGALPRRRPR